MNETNPSEVGLRCFSFRWYPYNHKSMNMCEFKLIWKTANHDPTTYLSLYCYYLLIISFINGWVMVGSFFKLNWECIFEGWMMVGCFSNWIKSISSRVGWWLAIFQMGFNAALLLYQWLGNGWQFFKLNWERIFKGWMMVGHFSNGVQCSIT